MKKLLLISIITSLSASAIELDTKHEDSECTTMLQTINAADGKLLEQLQRIKETKYEMCFNGDNDYVADNLTIQLLKEEAEKLYAIAVRKGEPATFGDTQINRLKPYAKRIADLTQYKVSNRQNWLLGTLDFVINGTGEQALLTNELLSGYLDDQDSDNLSPQVKAGKLGQFLHSANNGMIVSSLALGNRGSVTQMRGNGNSAQARYINRSASFASSESPANNTEPNKWDDLIEFQYDSDQLTPDGRLKFQETLSILKSNTSNSLLIIGHASPEGAADYNCQLSKQRALAIKAEILAKTSLKEREIKVAWAGENISLNFGVANQFLQARDIIVTDADNNIDPRRRRVEFELNGQKLLDRYRGRLCN